MSVSDNTCRYIVSKVRDAIGDGTADTMLARHEQLFVSMVEQRNHPWYRGKVIPIGLGAVFAAAAAIAMLLLLPDAPAPLEFQIGTGAMQGQPGVWIESNGNRTTEIRFQQGTRFQISRESAARVVESNESAVTIELSKGEVQAEVKGNHHTRWRVNAGPFTVTVLGTAFQVQWDARDSSLNLQVTKGVVLVQGGGLSHHGIRLSAGQSLVANGRSGEVSMGNRPSGAIKDAASSTPEAARNSDLAPERRENDATVERRSPGPSLDPWQIHYRKKQFAEAVSAAQKQGVDRIRATGSREDLWNLAEAARAAGRPDLSNDLLVSLRSRFKNSGKSRLAAFIIGRSAMDKSNSPAIAAQWFDTYLRESPGGTMAEEAHGRLMTLYTRMGQSDKASREARRYLEHYPNGLYARTARQVLHL